MSSENSVDAGNELRNSRLELLDIGLRNNLVSLRKTSKNLVAEQASAIELLGRMLDEQKAVGFIANGKSKSSKSEDLDEVFIATLPDASSEVEETISGPAPREENDLFGPSASDDMEASATLQKRVRITSRRSPMIETALSPAALFLQLLKMRSDAQTFLEEQGANLLFLAVGFLHWYESDSASEPRRAPLLLLPCTLVRGVANERFELQPTGDDVEVNLSLAAKLRADFGIALPMPIMQVAEESADEPAAQHWLRYLGGVTEAVRLQQRWKVVADEAVLGFFSFGKFLMFKDLDGDNWPDGLKPDEHPVIQRLLGGGFGEERAAFDEEVAVDSVIAPGDVHFVKDADSSQTQALLEIREGRNLVIQGPPGTGKSQTITNVIAELVGQQKTVLFVAEKMAALEVVKRRLDECHIGEAVLELHSHRATKSKVLKELADTLALGRPVEEAGDRDIAQLKNVQSELNRYCAAVADTIGQSGMDFGSVLGRMLNLQRQHPDLRALVWPALGQWSVHQYREAMDLTERMTMVMEALGPPRDSVFWGSKVQDISPLESNQIAQGLSHGLKVVSDLQGAALQLSVRLHLSEPAGLHDIDIVGRAASRAAEAPRLDGLQLSTDEWQQRRDSIKVLVQAGQAMRQQRDKWHAQLIDTAWTADVMPIRQAVTNYGGKWWNFLSSDWRTARKEFSGWLARPESTKPELMLTMVDAILDYQKNRKVYSDHATLGQMLFGAQWQQENSDWSVLSRVSQWVIELHDDIGKHQLPQGIVSFLAGHSDASGLGEEAGALGEQANRLKGQIEQVIQLLGLPTHDTQGESWASMPLCKLKDQLENWLEQLPQLHHLARFNLIRQEMDAAGLKRLAEPIADFVEPKFLLPQLELSWTQALVQEAYRAHPILARFDRLEHEHRIAQFRKLDSASLRHNQTKLTRLLWERKPRLGQPGEMAVLRNELNKKRRQLPIRQLMDRAGRAIQQIKPVFMMSPMSIANFLPPGKLSFDVVIFDEASQVKAVDALGAILRGKQVIVVGDTRQMPPTDFFSRDVENEEETATGDIESILSLFKAKGCNERYLKWHYRSRHESLIAVSNAEFYDSKLVIFPSSGANIQATGIELVHLPESVYDRGRTRTNKLEAQAVAKAVMAHAHHTPELTLGVAAFSMAQRDLIEVEVEMLRQQHPELESFFSQHPHEPFFVKNLENIQGDERDVVFISIGYGRNETGKIAREFGPLNRDGGHRRLNVLITRAKLAMKVFSNFRGEELELEANAKHGVRALRNLLKYAETRELEVSTETGRATDSPFEDQVLQALRDNGHRVEPQVGTAGYFIDMAVRHPELPGRYLLAIECDGAAYHSARSARDRDRLRQAVLEGLGWRFHRIWSTDWFRNPARETQRVLDAIRIAHELSPLVEHKPMALDVDPVEDRKTDVELLTPQGIERADGVVEELDIQFSSPYKVTELHSRQGVELLQAPTAMLEQMVKEVVGVESPVHTSVIIRRIMTAFGVGRAGTRVVSTIETAIKRIAIQQQWTSVDDFVMLRGQGQPSAAGAIRNRSALSATEKKIEWVSKTEIQNAVLKAIEVSFSISRETAVSTVSQWLGFGRASAKISAAIDEQLSALIRDEKIVEERHGMFKPMSASAK